MLGSCLVAKLVQCFLCCLTLVDDDGVVKVATLHQSCHQQGLYLAHEDECACGGNLLFEILHAVQRCKLTADELRLEVNHRGDGEVLIWEQCDARTRFVIFDFNLTRDEVVVLVGFLFLQAYATNFVDVKLGATVENGELRTINFYEHIIHSQRVEGSQSVFYGAHSYVFFAQDCTTRGFYYILGNGIDYGFSLKVGALYFVTVVLWCGIECHGEFESCVQTLSAQRETARKCMLFVCHIFNSQLTIHNSLILLQAASRAQLVQLFLHLVDLSIQVGQTFEYGTRLPKCFVFYGGHTLQG